jgi:hypothetical protein
VMLRLLLENPGETVSRDRFLDAVWGYTAFPITRTVDKHIASLRLKIGDHPENPRWILTVHGVGYRAEQGGGGDVAHGSLEALPGDAPLHRRLISQSLTLPERTLFPSPMKISKWPILITILTAFSSAPCFSSEHPPEKAPAWTIKTIMADIHKGDDSLARRAGKGEVTESELKLLVAYYLWMENQPPPQGDAASWKEKTAAISRAAMHLYAERTLELPALNGSADRFQKVMNCKACHTPHKPE